MERRYKIERNVTITFLASIMSKIITFETILTVYTLLLVNSTLNPNLHGLQPLTN